MFTAFKWIWFAITEIGSDGAAVKQLWPRHLTRLRYSHIGYFCTTSLEVKREQEGTSGSFLRFNQMQAWHDLRNTKITPCLYSGLEQKCWKKKVLNSLNMCPLVSRQGSNLSVWLKRVSEHWQDCYHICVNSHAPRMQFNNFGNPDVYGCQIFWFS